jgi:phenylpropionate dioxygenase-like ring-hydroxylating dioxygenase large terminal subunit
MFLRNFWYAAALRDEVGRQPLARTILGEPVLFYRKLDGSVAALEDRCSHRRVSLSKGRLVEDKVQCGYHGIMFDANGVCVSIPGQDTIPPQGHIKAFPVVERDGFVWIWPGDRAGAERGKLPDYSLCASPNYAGRTDRMRIDADYLLSIDNIMDLSHIAYVHQAYANDVAAAIRPTVKTDGATVTATRAMKDIENPPLYRRVIGTGHVDRVQELRFTPAGHLQLYVTIRGAGVDAPTLNVFYFSQLTPETARSHHTFFGVYRDFDIDNAEMTKLMGDQTVITVSEDKAVIEDQQRNWDQDGADRRMIDIAVDRGPLEARRLIRRLYEGERQDTAVAAAE